MHYGNYRKTTAGFDELTEVTVRHRSGDLRQGGRMVNEWLADMNLAAG
jgi:hypothetical protein